MLVTPVPVNLLIVVFELGKIAVFAMVLFCIDTIRLAFLTIPLMIVVVLFVVIGDSGLVVGSQQFGAIATGTIRAALSRAVFQKRDIVVLFSCSSNEQLSGQAFPEGGGECNE